MPNEPSVVTRPDAAHDDEYDELAAFHGIERERLVLIHPDSHRDAPAWGPDRYADVADQLAADGWQIAIVGDAPDHGRTGAVLGAMQTAALFLAGAVTPGALPRLIAHARLLVCDDAAASSPLAAVRALGASGTPQIVLAEHPRDTGSDTIVARARALLSSTGDAHPGNPFTLHMPATHESA
ncbi:glycosyl transferase family 9 [Caballeronia insecticola]|uniref:Glycosyl transferase family 9 n=1 Tax=Caballeronia insecticola TaxID=758793 RepID=R4WKI8_9BURK|nr:glycosyl transferase family 9 [Caballeronia insecticola]